MKISSTLLGVLASIALGVVTNSNSIVQAKQQDDNDTYNSAVDQRQQLLQELDNGHVDEAFVETMEVEVRALTHHDNIMHSKSQHTCTMLLSFLILMYTTLSLSLSSMIYLSLSLF